MNNEPFNNLCIFRAIFTTEEGETCNCPLNEIDLQFDELFHSLPVDTNEVIYYVCTHTHTHTRTYGHTLVLIVWSTTQY